jgi:hypothetical protein
LGATVWDLRICSETVFVHSTRLSLRTRRVRKPDPPVNPADLRRDRVCAPHTRTCGFQTSPGIRSSRARTSTVSRNTRAPAPGTPARPAAASSATTSRSPSPRTTSTRSWSRHTTPQTWPQTRAAPSTTSSRCWPRCRAQRLRHRLLTLRGPGSTCPALSRSRLTQPAGGGSRESCRPHLARQQVGRAPTLPAKPSHGSHLRHQPPPRRPIECVHT